MLVVDHGSLCWSIHDIQTLDGDHYPKSTHNDFCGWNFTIEKQDESEYYGFTLSDSRRFALSSGHITHNTMCSFHIAKEMKCKTLFLAANIDLIYQPMERLKVFFPRVKSGIVHLDKMEYKDCDIVFSTFQTIRARRNKIVENNKDFFDCFELIIVDEAHHIAALTYFETLHYFKSRYRIGLTATPRRHDDTHKMLFYTLGPICVEVTRKVESGQNSILQCVAIQDEPVVVSKETTVYKSEKPRVTVLDYDNEMLDRVEKKDKMMKRFEENICFSHLTKDYKRSNHIAKEWIDLSFPEQKRKTMCLSHRFDHHVHLLNAFASCLIKKQMMECSSADPSCIVRIMYYNRKKKQICFEPIFRMKRSKHIVYHDPAKFGAFVKLHFNSCYMDVSTVGKPDVSLKDHKDFIGLEIDFEKDYPVVRFGIFQGCLSKKMRPIIKSFVFRECKVIFMTYFLGKEGLDEDSLDTVIMASPAGRGSIIQAQGRALRKIYKREDGSWSRNDHHTIYVMDQYNAYFVSQSMNALSYFKSQRHIIHTKKIVERKLEKKDNENDSEEE